jgi:hypothetical protein
MSLEEVDKVDLIGTNRSTGNIELAIVDDFDWVDSNLHLTLLQNKIHAYMNFIESNQLYETYPSANNCSIVIVVLAKYQPCKKGIEFFENVREGLHNSGYEFHFRYITD